MSRHQRRAIGWAFAAVVVLGLWWLGAGRSGGTASPRVVGVVAVTHDLAAGARIRPVDVELRKVAYSPGLAHDLSDPSQVVGLRAAVAVPRGSVLVAPELAANRRVGAVVDVAVKLDPDAGVPAGDLSDARADLVLTTAGANAVTRVILANVTVVSTHRADSATVATLQLPPKLVTTAIRAESAGDLRLVAHVPGSGS